jgi:hypothetical protein
MISDNGVGQDDGSLQTNTWTDFSAWSDNHVGSDHSSGVNFGSLKVSH